jgi:hypothetical protein
LTRIRSPISAAGRRLRWPAGRHRRRRVAQVMPIAETVAELFYGRLFELDPTLRSMFRGDMREQGRKLMQMLAVAVPHMRG